MSMDLQHALRHAHESGQASFDLRDANEVIAPAMRRVRRQKTITHAASAVGATVIVVGGLWGVGELESRPMADLDAAAGGSEPAGPIIATMQPDSGVRLTEAVALPSILTLVDDSTPRTLGEASTGRSAALKCPRNQDPLATHDYSVPGTSYAFVDCVPIWIDGDVQLTLDDSTVVTFDQAAQSVRVDYVLVNSGSTPVEVYTDPYGTIQTDPNSHDSTSFHGDGVAVSSTTMWNGEDSVVAQLTSNHESQVLLSGAAMAGTLEWRASEIGGPNEINRILDGATTFFFTINPRLVHSDPAAAVLILEVGGPEFTYLTTQQTLTRQ